MIFTYERIASQLNKEIIMCPADYPIYIQNLMQLRIFWVKIIIGEKLMKLCVPF